MNVIKAFVAYICIFGGVIMAQSVDSWDKTFAKSQKVQTQKVHFYKSLWDYASWGFVYP